MTWSKGGGKGSDGSFSQPWQVWRGSWNQAPWRQQHGQQQGHKGKDKGQSKGTGKGKQASTFPAYDLATPVVDVVQEIPKQHTDSYISELQRAINSARKLETQVRKLDVLRQEKARQWRQWQEDLKQSFAREKARFIKDMHKIEQDTMQAAEELSKARANLRYVATGDSQMEPVDAGHAAIIEEDFAALLESGTGHVAEEVTTEEANMEVLKRAMEAAARSSLSPVGTVPPAATPARRTAAPAMTPYQSGSVKAMDIKEPGTHGTYTASPGMPVATDPYLTSPMAPTLPSATAASRPKESRSRTGLKDGARPKQPIMVRQDLRRHWQRS